MTENHNQSYTFKELCNIAKERKKYFKTFNKN